jgi:hypothetical protein
MTMAVMEKTGMDYAAMLRPRGMNANVLSPISTVSAWGEFDGIMPADKRIQDLTQAIIDSVDDHKHLRKARILVLIKQSDSAAKKLEDGQRVVCGHAQKASSRFKAIMASTLSVSCKDKKKTLTADFILTLSGDYLDLIGALCDGGDLVDCPGVRRAAALIDHELCHCSAIIAGKNVPLSEKEPTLNELGDAFLDTSEPDSDGFVFIRYYKLKNDRFQWKMRKHDLEEFAGVVERNGAWCPAVRKMEDVIEEMSEEQRSLFDGK